MSNYLFLKISAPEKICNSPFSMIQYPCFMLITIRSIRMKNKQQFIKQFISYLFVGGGATIVEWVGFWIFDHCLHIQYLVATALAFFFSTFANWLFGRLLTFKNSDKNIILELLQIYLTSIIGLLFNLIIMYVLVSKFSFPDMLSKIVATGIVFFYNFLVRKLIIYKNS